MTPFITAQTVAELIGFIDAAAFLRQRERLEDDENFPRPMPTMRRPLVWRRDAVEAWRASTGLPRGQAMTVAQAQAAGPNVRLLAEARRA